MRGFGVYVLAVLVLCRVCVVISMSVRVGFDEEMRISDNNTVVASEAHEHENSDYELPNRKDDLIVPQGEDECKEGCVTENVTVSSEEKSDEARAIGEARKKKKQQDLMSRILPMMVIPFMIQTAMIPMVLTTLKFMLIKSAFIGKLAIILGLLNALRRSQNNGGVYSHNINIKEDTEKLHQMHYGYYGAPEYGAWINR